MLKCNSDGGKKTTQASQAMPCLSCELNYLCSSLQSKNWPISIWPPCRELARSSNQQTTPNLYALTKPGAYHNWLMTQNPSVPLTATWLASPDFPEYVTQKLLGGPPPMVDVDVRLDEFTSDLGQVSCVLQNLKGSITCCPSGQKGLVKKCDTN